VEVTSQKNDIEENFELIIMPLQNRERIITFSLIFTHTIKNNGDILDD